MIALPDATVIASVMLRRIDNEVGVRPSGTLAVRGCS